ncbi:MAG: hypothetical protein QM762_12750 [Chryseolinea sp.]
MLNDPKTDKKAGEFLKFYTASAAVYSVLEDLQYGEERFNQFLKWAFDAVRELHFDVLHEVHVDEFEMTPWKSLEFPCDMVGWSKIGFRCGDVVKVFTQDSGISKYFDKDSKGVPQENKSGGCPDLADAGCSGDDIIFYSDDFFSTGYGHYYGTACNYNHAGYFSVDWRNRVFNFRNTVNNVSKIYLEYITDGLNPTGKTVIHPYAFKAVQDFIHWKRKEYDDRFSESERDRAQKLYENEVEKVLMRNLTLSIEDIQEALRSGYRQTIKN